jgi:hypothetical protein
MKPYGMALRDLGDVDVNGITTHGRSTHFGNLAHNADGDARAYNALRGGGRAKVRRVQKRRARRDGKFACRDSE